MVVNDAAVKDQLQIGALKWLSLQELNYPFYQNVKRLKNFSAIMMKKSLFNYERHCRHGGFN